MKINELKEQLELAINERLVEFKVLADQYKLMTAEIDFIHHRMIDLATELKGVENIIRLRDNTYPDMFDVLLNTKIKKSK